MKRMLSLFFLIGEGLLLNVVHAADQTLNGLYYPTGTSKFSVGGDYMEKDYLGDGLWDHLSVDVIAPLNYEVLMVADGIISYISCNGWGSGNVGVVFRHYTDDGRPFASLSAHMQWEDFYERFGKDSNGVEQIKRSEKGGCFRQDISGKNILVKAGKPVGKVGYYIGGDHVHETVWDTKDECITIPPKHFGRVLISDHPDRNDPLCTVHPFQNSIHPATLIPKGTQDFYRGGDYIYQGSDLCATANARFKIVDGLRSDYWVTKEVSQSEACPGIEKAIESTLQSARDNGGVVKVSDIVSVEKAPWWSSWLSFLFSRLDSLFSLVQTPAALAADPSVQRDLVVHNAGEVYEIKGTNKRVVILTDGPGMNGDKAIDLGSYAEADPAETFAPITGNNASGKQSDLVVTKLWTERSSGHVWNTIGFGDTVCMVAESKNAGNKDVSRDVKITFYVSKGNREDKHPDPVGSEMIPAKYLSKVRTAKATTRHCVDIHGDNYPSGYPGAFNFGVHIDPDNREPESNEKNNWKGEQVFTLTENPHLSISQLWFSNPAAQPGEGVTAYVRIRNSGTPFGSDKVNTEWRVQGPQYGPDPIVIGFDQTRHDHLRTNDEAQEEVSFVMPTMPGDYVFSAEVDYDFRTAQSDRSVMTASISFTISEPENDDIEDGTLVDPNAPIACPLITPDTWEKWSVQPYSPPFDWFSGNRLVISPICSPNQPDMLDLIFGTEGDSNVLVYKTVHVRNSKTGVDTTLTVECSEGELWGDYCQGGARLTVSGAQVDTSSVVQPTLILAYICHQVDDVWKCGCKDVTCTEQGYQQQAAAIAH